MHNAANNTEKYEGKSPLWEFAPGVRAENIVSPPTNRLHGAAEMKAELRGEDIKGADAERTMDLVMWPIFPGELAVLRPLTSRTAVPGSRWV